MKPAEFMDFLHVLENMKCNTRHGWTHTGRRESVAEHTFRVCCMALLLEEETAGDKPVGELYEEFCQSLDQALHSAAGEMEDYMDQAALSRGALHFALLSYAAGLVSRHYVRILRQSRSEPAPTRREKREKKNRHTEAGEGETQE